MWLQTLRGKGYAAVVVMDYLGCGKPLSTFKFLLYFIYICCVIEKVTSEMLFLLGFSSSIFQFTSL